MIMIFLMVLHMVFCLMSPPFRHSLLRASSHLLPSRSVAPAEPFRIGCRAFPLSVPIGCAPAFHPLGRSFLQMTMTSEVQGECRAELARAMLSRSLHSRCISNASQRYNIREGVLYAESITVGTISRIIQI